MDYSDYQKLATCFLGSLTGCALGYYLSERIYSRVKPLVNGAVNEALFSKRDSKKSELETKLD